MNARVCKSFLCFVALFLWVKLSHAQMSAIQGSADSVCVATSEPRELLSVRTNLPEWVAAIPKYGFCPMPNVAVEIYPRKGHFSYGIAFDCPWWSKSSEHQYFRLRNYTLETRYYPDRVWARSHRSTNGSPFRGFYISAYANTFVYEIALSSTNGMMGEGVGAGAGVGYAMPLGSKGRWRMDFGVKLGWFVTNYDKYRYGCPVEKIDDGRYYYDFIGKPTDFRKRLYRYNWFGPTRVEISLSYDLFRHRRQKGGAQ